MDENAQIADFFVPIAIYLLPAEEEDRSQSAHSFALFPLKVKHYGTTQAARKRRPDRRFFVAVASYRPSTKAAVSSLSSLHPPQNPSTRWSFPSIAISTFVMPPTNEGPLTESLREVFFRELLRRLGLAAAVVVPTFGCGSSNLIRVQTG